MEDAFRIYDGDRLHPVGCHDPACCRACPRAYLVEYSVKIAPTSALRCIGVSPWPMQTDGHRLVVWERDPSSDRRTYPRSRVRVCIPFHLLVGPVRVAPDVGGDWREWTPPPTVH